MYLSHSPNSTTTLHKPAALATLLVHACVLGLLWWGARWFAPQPTEVELWDAGSLGGGTVTNQEAAAPAATPTHTAPAPAVVDTPTSPAPSVNEPPPAMKPDIAAPTSKPTPTPKPQTQPQPSTTKPNTAQPSANTARNDVLAQARTGTATGAGSGTGSGSAAGSGNANYAGYVSKVKSMIENRGRNQGLSGIAGRVSFRVAPNGAVTSVSVSGMPPDKAETLKRVISGMVLPRDDGVIPQPVLSGGMSFSVRI